MIMSRFEEFKKVFEDTYDSVYYFANEEQREYDQKECPFKFREMENLDSVNYDSYGYEDSTLRRIFYIEDFDIHVEFYGNRSSYNGVEWHGFKQVNKKTKTINIWE